MPELQPASLAIFRAGKHVSTDGRTLEFSAADLPAIAAAYDPAVSEAPLVVGHPTIDAPAYGWAKSLVAEGNILYAEPDQVEPQFAEMVNAGRLKKISASIYLPDSPGNPTPGKHYLRHIGFLGAQPPSVKGLPSAKFAEGDGAVEFAAPAAGDNGTIAELFGRVRDWFAEREAAGEAMPTIPAAAFAEPASNGRQTKLESTPETTMPDDKQAAAFAERENVLNTRQSEIDAREKSLAAREAKARREDAAEFCEGLVQAGKLLPREKAPLVEVLLAMPAEPVSFAEGDATVQKPAGELLRAMLSDLPKRVDYAEKSRASDTPAPASFAAPNGETVDASQLELHRKAVAYQAEHPNTPYLAAVKAVGG